jgi:chromosomal replication initiator protein
LSIPNFQDELLSSSSHVNKEENREAAVVWSAFLENVRRNLSELKFNTWFKPILAKSFENNTLMISVPSQDFYEMIISRFGDIVSKSLIAILGKEGKLVYEIDNSQIHKKESEPVNNPNNIVQSEVTSVPIQQTFGYNNYGHNSEHEQQYGSAPGLSYKPVCLLNPEYTFDNFVKGKNNEFATAAALSISNRPGAQYNPLMIYGGVGLGKTHLVQAIGNHLKNTIPSSKVMYISGPEFTTSFVQGIRSNKVHEFERYYKSLDILILDDIQFLEGKESTQDSFFQIFNSLYQLKRQIVLSCDKPPHQLEGLEERLITRFQWGLTVDIQPPDLETRIAILNKKCEAEKVAVTYDVLEFIALNIKDNIRSLEGCLKSIIFDAELSRMPIDIDIAKRSVVKFGVLKNRKQNLDISTIIAVVSKFFDIDESLLRLKTKRQEIVTARHAAMYLSKELTNCSLQTIGAHFGGRNHATVIHAVKCIEEGIINDKSFAEKIQQLKENLLTS